MSGPKNPQKNLRPFYANHSAEHLKEALRRMHLVRKFEETAEDSYVRGLTHGTMHLSIGQEASVISKSLSQISLEMKDLAARAQARKLQLAEYQGGTTTISNLGMYGVEQITAIINPPQQPYWRLVQVSNNLCQLKNFLLQKH